MLIWWGLGGGGGGWLNVVTLDNFISGFSCFIIIIVIIYPLTTSVAGAPQMIVQPVFSIFPCSPLPSGTCRTPGLSIPWCCLPTSSSVCPVFLPLSLCLVRWFWPDLMNGKQDHTTAVAYAMKNIVDKACSLVNECYLCTTVSNLVNTTGEFKYRKPLQSQFIARF